MTSSSGIGLISQRIDRFYFKHVRRRVRFSIVLVAISSTSIPAIVFLVSSSGFLTVAAFVISAFLTVNVSLFCVVPPNRKLLESKALMMAAIQNPSRIQSVDGDQVVLTNAIGETFELDSLNQKLWERIVIPHMLKTGNRVGATTGPTTGGRTLTDSERRAWDEKQANVIATEKKIKSEYAAIQQEREDLELRSKELENAENIVIDRLSSVEVAQAELEQMREDVEMHEQAQKNRSTPVDPEEFRIKEDRLREKEREIEALKNVLAEDQKIVRAQKTELNQMKGDLLKDHDSVENPESDDERDLASRERALERKLREIEMAAQEVEERTKYVSNAEESLIDRLNELSEREASVEQSEINSGLRQDA